MCIVHTFCTKAWPSQVRPKEGTLNFAAANGTSVDADKLEWWKNHAVQLPFWSTGCQAILLLQPSFAAAERIFWNIIACNLNTGCIYAIYMFCICNK